MTDTHTPFDDDDEDIVAARLQQRGLHLRPSVARDVGRRDLDFDGDAAGREIMAQHHHHHEPGAMTALYDTLAPLLTIAKFMPAGRQKVIELRHASRTVGYGCCNDHPESEIMPVLDAATGEITTEMLCDWLQRRGHEPAACRWQAPHYGKVRDPDDLIDWVLEIGRHEGELPRVPRRLADPQPPTNENPPQFIIDECQKLGEIK